MSYNLEFHKRMEALQVTKSTVPGEVLDMHLHMVDFIQNTEGLYTLLGAMDEVNVTRAVIFGLPVTKKWAYYGPEKPHYYLDNNTPCYYFASTDEIVATHYLNLSKEERIRFAPTLCGFNPTDLCSIDYIKKMFENGEPHNDADVVISAADGYYIIFEMLGGQYIDQKNYEIIQ